MIGLSYERIKERTIEDTRSIMHPDDVSRLQEHRERITALAPGEAVDFIYRIRHVDGGWRWLQSRDTVFERDDSGAVRRSIGTATDITAIKEAEEALRENNRRMDFVLSAANMGVLELNLETGAAVWSEPLARVFGLSVTDVPENLEELLELVHPDERERERSRYQEALATGTLYQSEFQQNLPDGKDSLDRGSRQVAYDESGRPLRLFGLGWDVTARKLAEEQRARFEEQLRQSHKMEALGTLAGGIAHDFNNILTAVSGNARLASQELPMDHPARICIEEISRGTTRATDLVRRILAFSRNEEPRLRPVDLQTVVEEAVRLLRDDYPGNR